MNYTETMLLKAMTEGTIEAFDEDGIALFAYDAASPLAAASGDILERDVEKNQLRVLVAQLSDFSLFVPVSRPPNAGESMIYLPVVMH
ncbi:MAG: hypothetical protein R2867_17250 [Caldilineaceae bacterium]